MDDYDPSTDDFIMVLKKILPSLQVDGVFAALPPRIVAHQEFHNFVVRHLDMEIDLEDTEAVFAAVRLKITDKEWQVLMWVADKLKNGFRPNPLASETVH